MTQSELKLAEEITGWKACRVKQYDVDFLDRINMERTEQAYLYNFGEGKL